MKIASMMLQTRRFVFQFSNGNKANLNHSFFPPTKMTTLFVSGTGESLFALVYLFFYCKSRKRRLKTYPKT